MASEANRDEIIKCKQIAADALASGDNARAVRFLLKAKGMAPGDASVEELLRRAQEAPSSSASQGARPSSSAEARPRVAPDVQRMNKAGEAYTAEQMQVVQKVLKTRNYYDVLAVRKGADEKSITSAYRQIARKLHPDKNKAPGAEEAFKKLSKVYTALTDEEKRNLYDQYGDEEHAPQQHRHHHHHDMSPEEVFAQACGFGGFYTRRTHHQQAQGDDGNGGAQRTNVLQILPIVIVVLLTLTSNITARDGVPKFSFRRNPPQFQDERVTPTLSVTYFVLNGFDELYPPGARSRAEFEQMVEVYHVRALFGDCDRQEKAMQKAIMTAKRAANDADLNEAKNYPRPACKSLERVRQRQPNIYRAAVMGY